jgi:2-polyprenyl-3-methyl-5-hydroxy-6-metoxy-1,4-benzoquinol methylase
MTTAYRSAVVARAYLTQRPFYWYARCKLASDPLYAGVGAALRDTQAPLLDLGCGIGLLVHTLRAQGFKAHYLGVDNDAGKIAAAREAVRRVRLSAARFDHVDLARESWPPHRGSVALLDVLQFVSPAAQKHLVECAAACIAPAARLVIRSCLDQSGARTRITRAVDAFSRRVGWMNAAPTRYPTRAALDALLSSCGLRATFSPLRGRMPFNNWLIVAERAG